MNNALALRRLENILVEDRRLPNSKIENILKSEAYIMLEQFFDIKLENVLVKISASEVTIKAKTKRLKGFLVLD